MWSEWLPYIFATLMGVSILVYVILDGFDLGIGILSPLATDSEKDRMVSAIGPFWDANETWLVLAVGLLLVAFPVAHGVILTTLYFPVAVLMIGLILRGVAFEFRAKVSLAAKPSWNRMFFIGSMMSALSQGYMLGLYVLGLDTSWPAVGFALLVAACLAAAYAAIGAAWLIHKTEGALQRRAVVWLRSALGLVALGMAAISLATPLASSRILDRWLGFPRKSPPGPVANPDCPPVRLALAAFLKPAARGRPAELGALCRAGRHLCTWVRRARLVVLSLCGARTAHHHRGRQRHRKPRHHPGRNLVRAACDHRLLDLGLPHLRRQGGSTCVMTEPA